MDPGLSFAWLRSSALRPATESIVMAILFVSVDDIWTFFSSAGRSIFVVGKECPPPLDHIQLQTRSVVKSQLLLQRTCPLGTARAEMNAWQLWRNCVECTARLQTANVARHWTTCRSSGWNFPPGSTRTLGLVGQKKSHLSGNLEGKPKRLRHYPILGCRTAARGCVQ